MTVFQRYMLIQLPGFVMAAVVLYALHQWAGLETRWAAALWAAYVLKDLLLYPFLRRAYDPVSQTGTELLVGATGTARQPLEPDGYVEIRGELWHAELAPGAAPVAQGAGVKVQGFRGLTLIVTQE